MADAPLPTLKPFERPLAQMYLRDAEQPEWQVWLTDLHIYVLRGGLVETLPLNEVQGLGFESRRPMAAVIGGGLLLLLSCMAIAQHLFTPLLLLALFFAAFFLFYFGVNGRKVLAIHRQVGPYDVLLKNHEEHHEEFVKFANRLLTHTQGSRQWWLRAPASILPIDPDSSLATPREGWPLLPAQAIGQVPPSDAVYVRIVTRYAEGDWVPSAQETTGLRFVGTLPPSSRAYIMAAPTTPPVEEGE